MRRRWLKTPRQENTSAKEFGAADWRGKNGTCNACKSWHAEMLEETEFKILLKRWKHWRYLGMKIGQPEPDWSC